MDKTERFAAHKMNLSPNYEVRPEAHLGGGRDRAHAAWCLDRLLEKSCKTVFDIGSFDGWLDFLLIKKGYIVESCELRPELVAFAKKYAEQNSLSYEIRQGFFDELSFDKKYDCVIAFEVLEHVDMDMVKEYIKKIDSLAVKQVLISLPLQDCAVNPQHLWSPDMPIIDELFAGKKNLKVTTVKYSSVSVPPNFLISYDA